ncbi:MAG: alpha/beta hydrolase [Bacteroidetes bacterium]|nr:alpha/beta hydrolase [Bacteroidota bacterium]
MFKKIFTTMLFVFTSSFAQTFLPNGNYASVNGLKMYYEIHLPDSQAGGNNLHKPVLVLIHGGGSTITTSFGTILPMLTKHRTVIAVELQGHGHTGDRNTPESFEQDADDVAALLNELKIKQADFLGFSNGGSTALQIGIRHPETVRKLIVVAGVFKRNGFPPQFWDGMKQVTLDKMPEKLKEAYLKVAPNPKDLIQMFNKDLQRMLMFKDFRTEDIRSIQAPTFLINGDADVVLPEHAVEIFRLLPHAKLAILPGGHGECIGEIEYVDKQSALPQATVSMVEEFLDAPMLGKK